MTSDVLAAISKGPCRELLVAHGFRRSAPHFWRNPEGVNHAIQFQASSWGSADGGSFTINLGVTTPALHETVLGQPFPANPGTACCWPFGMRIGALLPGGRDRWWEISSAADAEPVGRELVAALRDFALPFFDGLRRREDLAEWVQRDHGAHPAAPCLAPLLLAESAAIAGDREAARSILAAASGEFGGAVFEEWVRRLSSRRELTGQRE